MNDDGLSIPKNIDLTVIEMEEYWSSEGQKVNKPNGCNPIQSHIKFLHCRIYVKILQVTFQLLVGIFQIKKCLCDISEVHNHKSTQWEEIIKCNGHGNIINSQKLPAQLSLQTQWAQHLYLCGSSSLK